MIGHGTYHSSDHDHVRSEALVHREYVQQSNDPEHDVNAVDSVTQAHCGSMESQHQTYVEQTESDAVADVPLAGRPIHELVG